MGAFVWRTEILKIETQELEDRQVELTVEVPEDRVQAAKRSSAKRLSKDARIPGFRPGKAPYEVILSKYGEEVIFEEALEILGQEAYRESLDDAELDPYAPGSLEEIVSRDPLVLRFTVPLVPEVELGDYREIRIPYEESEVTDEAVESMMEELRQRQALIEPVERPAEDSDIVVLDIHGELLDQEDDEDAELVNQDGVSILVDEETDFPFLGIYEHLMGMVEGDEKTVEHTFPEDYAAEDLQNKHVSFQLKCSGVKSRLVPEWSDDLAKSIGEFEDLLDLRIKVRESLTEQATQEAETAYAEQVMEMVIEGAQVTYPPIVLENEIDHLMRDLEMRLSSQNLAFDDYLKIEGKNAEEIRDELKPAAEERVSRGLVLGQVVEDENIEVGDEEVTQEIERMLEPLGDSGNDSLKEVFDTPEGRNRIGMDLLTKKAMDRLMDISKGEAEYEETEDDHEESHEEQPDQEIKE
jgi:trigger factor